MTDTGPYIELRGDLHTDGSIVYIGGMDLDAIIRAAIPGYATAKSAGKTDHGNVVITIERVAGDDR